MTMKNNIKRFKNLFDSYQSAYGLISDLEEDDTGKVQGKNILIRNKITDEIFEKHLSGKGAGLRLIPLKENCKVRFAAIDLDSKCPTNPLKHTIEELEVKIRKLGLPLIPCKSKSGDVHLYCFSKEDVDAKVFMSTINKWASLLGYGAAEKFPKQTSRANEDDVGQALNIPYYDEAKTQRFAIRKGKKLSFSEFLEYAEISSVTADELKNFVYENLDESYKDAPPCLQMVALNGVDDGGRNNGLFSLAVYYKKKYPDDFEEHIMRANGTLINPPLNFGEVSAVIKSVNKKDFFYRCNEAPCVQFCNKTECYKVKFGIGNFDQDDQALIEKLVKYVSADSVKWYAECMGYRVQLTTEDLWSHKNTSMKIFERTGKILKPMKNDTWVSKVLTKLMKSCETFEDPEDASKKGQFKEIFTQWLENQSPISRDRERLRTSGICIDDKTNEILFRSPDLFSHLKAKRFPYLEQDIWHWLKEDFKGDRKAVRTGTLTVKCWCIPAGDFLNIGELEDKL
jgi:hypothetical protein